MQSHADKTGGMISIDGNHAYINGSSFAMSSSNYGGAIYIGGTKAKITSTTFEGNYTEGSGAHGGALYLAKSVVNTTLENIIYIDNAVKGSGAKEADLYSAE